MNDQDLVPWLLEATIPSIRYLALRRLLDRPEGDAEVQSAWLEMKAAGPIPTTLAGNWAGERSYHTPSTSAHTEHAAHGTGRRWHRLELAGESRRIYLGWGTADEAG